jgi:hypothetical protein
VWEVILVDEVEKWFLDLAAHDPEAAEVVAGAIDLLVETGNSELRVLFVFDPKRRAVLLVAGDKTGRWQQWYRDNILLAEERYDRWLMEEEG